LAYELKKNRIFHGSQINFPFFLERSPRFILVIKLLSIEIAWITNTEFDSIGFHLWRATGEGWKYGDYSTVTRLTVRLIPAEGNSGAGATYSYIDSDVEPGLTYYYGLEDRNGVGQPTYYLDDIDSATAK